jgi:hypothetical protein
MRNAHKILAENHKGKKPLCKPKRGLEDIKMDFKEICCACVDRIQVAQDMLQGRDLVNSASNIRVPSKTDKFLNNINNSSFSVRALLHVTLRQFGMEGKTWSQEKRKE